jgi:hypothetical protein
MTAASYLIFACPTELQHPANILLNGYSFNLGLKKMKFALNYKTSVNFGKIIPNI